MGERVSQGVARMVSIEHALRGQLHSAALGEVLQLNRLVQVIGTFDYRVSNVFCS